MTREWYCVKCSAVLGETLANELVVTPANVARVYTRGANTLVECRCGDTKVWYPNDIVVRAVYQLIDAFVTVGTARMIRAQN